MKTTIKVLSTLSLALLFSFSALMAETPEEKANRIIDEADKYTAGWGDQQANMKMIIRNKNGKEKTRSMRSKALESHTGDDMMLMIFDTPKDVKGTALLTHAHANRQDDQWFYIPALNRIKRISSNSKGGQFMGSEFSFEDLGDQGKENFKDIFSRSLL